MNKKKFNELVMEGVADYTRVNENNKFVQLIYDRRLLNKSGRIKLYLYDRKVKKLMYNFSTLHELDYSTLWDIANFIKFAEEVYFFDNSLKDKFNINNRLGLYSSRSYINGENGFKISIDTGIVTIKLSSISKKFNVFLEVNKPNGYKNTYSFINGTWSDDFDPTKYDELFIDYVSDIIAKRFYCMFFSYYYQ